MRALLTPLSLMLALGCADPASLTTREGDGTPPDEGQRDALADGEQPDACCLDLGVEQDGALADGALADGALADGALADGALADGALADGALADGARPDPDMAVLDPDAAVCADECVAGQRRCEGAGVRACGQHDGDPCLEWSPVAACGPGTACDPDTVTCREPCGDFCDPFSVVVLPDTQYYTNKRPATYTKQMQWILDHREDENIQFVIHLGDVTNNNTREQWLVADAAHRMLDNAGMPYSVVPGNHDYFVDGSDFSRTDSQFDTFFGPARFAGRPYYGGGRAGSNESNYTFFEVGPLKFLVLSLEYAPRKDTLCWADDLIERYPDHRVIIVTHCYLTKGGGYAMNCPDEDYYTLGATGETVFDELVSRHSNIFMVLSGHIGESHHRIKHGNNGNPIHEMIVDYQFEAACSAADPSSCSRHCQNGTYTGNGWMRQMIFDPRANEISARTFTVEDGNAELFPRGVPTLFCSPLFTAEDAEHGGNYYSSDPHAADHKFTFSYDFQNMPAYARDDGDRRAFLDRTVNRVADGDQLRPLVSIAPNDAFVAVWEDDSNSTDGDGSHDIMARGFNAGGCAGFQDIVVNPEQAGQQRNPAMAMDAQGNFVVVWEDDSDLNGAYQIYGRGFNADGTERFPRFTVNSVATGQQRNPAVAMAPDGRFVVAWDDDPASDQHEQIVVRGFNVNGSQRFGDRSVHNDVAGRRLKPAIGLDGQGNAVVVWEDDSDGNGVFQIRGRGLSADGTPRFGPFTVNSVDDGQQRDPSVGVGADGRFVVAWEDEPNSDGVISVLARGFNADGSGRLADFAVSSLTGAHLDPVVSMAPGSAFAVAWAGDGDGNGTFQAMGKTYRAGGETWRGTWALNRVAHGQQLSPSIALNDRGKVVSAWQDDMDDNGTYQIVAAGVDSD